MDGAVRFAARAAPLALLLGCHGHTVGCYIDGQTAHCAAIPVRQRTSVIVQVNIDENRSCTVDAQPVPCADVGRTIRAAHSSDDPTVSLCASRSVTYDIVGSVLAALTAQFLTVQFACASGGSLSQPNPRLDRSRGGGFTAAGGEWKP